MSVVALAVAGCSKGGGGDTLAVVNGESIPMSQYYKTMEMKQSVVAQVDPSRLTVDPSSGQIPRQVAEVAVDPSYRLSVQVLRDCINDTITKQLAKDEGVYPTKEEIDGEIDLQQKRKPNYVKDLSAAGYTVDEIKSGIASQLCMLRLMSKGITVTPDEVNQYIKENPARFTEPEQAVLSMIEVPDQKTKDQADKELKEGQLFNSVAQHYSVQSDGKARGYRFPETAVDRFPVALKVLVAKTAEFAQTDWQYDKPSTHWVKFYVEKKIKAKPIAVDDFVKEMVRRDLLVNKGGRANDVNKRLADKLKASKIEVKVKYLEDPWKKLYDSMTAANSTSAPTAQAPNTNK